MNTLTERNAFDTLADAVCRADGVDRVSLSLAAECSDFLRFNRAALRQATQVAQAYATLAVVRGSRRAEATVSLGGDAARDIAALQAERARLTADLAAIPDDPWLLLPEAATHSARDERGTLPEAAAVIDAVTQRAEGRDLVGFLASGPVARGYADSLGSRHWHRVESFHFDWCLYQRADKAVKTAYAGNAWDDAAFEAKLADASARVELLKRPVRTLAPGAYRTAFAPAAMHELLQTLAWGGFGLKARRTGVSPLMALAHGDAALHHSIRLSEATASGLAPGFTSDGFVKPSEVLLVDGGRTIGTLNSPRSAREYGLAPNGATGAEAPESLALAPGRIPADQLLQTLGTGLYVSDLWYLNYSDRQACRMTGMTRFACFWVEDGELVAPLDVMRFDDSFLRMFGEGLVGLTDHAETIPDGESYQSRRLGSITTPAAVVEGWRLTL